MTHEEASRPAIHENQAMSGLREAETLNKYNHPDNNAKVNEEKQCVYKYRNHTFVLLRYPYNVYLQLLQNINLIFYLFIFFKSFREQKKKQQHNTPYLGYGFIGDVIKEALRHRASIASSLCRVGMVTKWHVVHFRWLKPSLLGGRCAKVCLKKKSDEVVPGVSTGG